MKLYSIILVVLLAGCSSIYATSLQTDDQIVCGPVCDVYCQFGNVLNAHGCPTCRCKLAPDTFADPEPVLMVEEETLTTSTICYPVRCRLYCPYGWKVDPTTGCEYCDCKDPPTQ